MSLLPPLNSCSLLDDGLLFSKLPLPPFFVFPLHVAVRFPQLPCRAVQLLPQQQDGQLLLKFCTYADACIWHLCLFCSEQSSRSNRNCGKNIEKGLSAAFLSLLYLAPERPVVPLRSLVVCTSIRSVRIGQLILSLATLLGFGLIVLQHEVKNAPLLSLTHFGFSLLFVSQSLGVSPVCVYTDFC